jgi:AcrR family transcriptional regulator
VPERRPKKSDPTRVRLTRSERRDAILAAARRAFVANGGMGGTKTKEIAAQAGVTEALIFQHFADKEELFSASVAEPLSKAIADLTDRQLPVDEQAKPQYEATLDFYRKLLTSMFESVEALGVVLFSGGQNESDFYGENIGRAISKMVTAVEVNLPTWKHVDFDPRFVSTVAFGACFGLALDHTFNGPLDVDQSARQLVDLVFYGLVAR